MSWPFGSFGPGSPVLAVLVSPGAG